MRLILQPTVSFLTAVKSILKKVYKLCGDDEKMRKALRAYRQECGLDSRKAQGQAALQEQ